MAEKWENGKGVIQYAGKTYNTQQGAAGVQLHFKMRRLNDIKKEERIVKGRKL